MHGVNPQKRVIRTSAHFFDTLHLFCSSSSELGKGVLVMKKILCLILIQSFLCLSFLEAEGMQHNKKTVDMFDFQETPLSEIAKIFTEVTGKNVVPSNNIKDMKVTLFLKHVTPQHAIEIMCKFYDLWYKEEKNIIYLQPRDEYEKELAAIKCEEGILVYNLKYVSASEVAKLIDSLYGDRIIYTDSESGQQKSRNNKTQHAFGTSRTTRTYPGSKESSITMEQIKEIEKKKAMDTIEQEDILSITRDRVDVYLSVFTSKNSIVVRSIDHKILKEIKDFISRIDTPIPQVLIEGKILELSLGDSFESFFDFNVKSSDGQQSLHLLGGKKPEGSTLAYDFINKTIQMRMQLFQEENRVNIIGSPMILCANNFSGEFFIGEKRPIIINYEHEIREFEERTTEVIRPVIEFKEIGTKLTITPIINEDKTVRMLLFAEFATVKPAGSSVSIVTQDGTFQSLPIDTVNSSTIETSVLAEDGKILAIGGLIRETDGVYERKVPFLGDIPLLGNLFKQKALNKKKIETVILIIPHVIMSPKDGSQVSGIALSEISDHLYVNENKEKMLYDNNDKRMWLEEDVLE